MLKAVRQHKDILQVIGYGTALILMVQYGMIGVCKAIVFIHGLIY